MCCIIIKWNILGRQLKNRKNRLYVNDVHHARIPRQTKRGTFNYFWRIMKVISNWRYDCMLPQRENEIILVGKHLKSGMIHVRTPRTDIHVRLTDYEGTISFNVTNDICFKIKWNNLGRQPNEKKICYQRASCKYDTESKIDIQRSLMDYDGVCGCILSQL